MAESGLANEGRVLRAVGHVKATEKVLILHGSRVAVAVVLQILQIGLNQRVHVAHLRHEEMLALHDTIKHVVEGKGSRRKRLSALSWCRGRRRRCRRDRSG